MGEESAGLARASCSTKEHIRAIDGSVPLEEASNLTAGLIGDPLKRVENREPHAVFAVRTDSVGHVSPIILPHHKIPPLSKVGVKILPYLKHACKSIPVS